MLKCCSFSNKEENVGKEDLNDCGELALLGGCGDSRAEKSMRW